MTVRVGSEHVRATEPRVSTESGPGLPSSDRSASFRYFRRLTLNAACLSVGDTLALGLALVLAGALRFWFMGEALMTPWWALVVVSWLVGASYVGLMPGWGIGVVEELRRTILVWVKLFGLTAMGLFFFKVGADVSRLTVTLAFLFSAPLLLASRALVKTLLVKLNVWGLPTVIYGGGRTGALVLDALEEERGLGLNPIGFFDDDPQLRHSRIGGLSILGHCHQNTPAAPVAIMAMPGVSAPRLVELLESSLAVYRLVIIIPDLFDAPSLWVKPRDFMGILGLQISNNLLRPLSRFIKRAMDLFLTVTTLPVWLPLCAMLAVLVWLVDFGNPFFLQYRIGRNGRRFRMWKFRTMVKNAQEVLEKKLTQDPKLKSEWEESFKLRRDPRITWIGKFLRRTSIDELPQLFNVLRGEMSLVGPRPVPSYHNEELTEKVRKLRDHVRPGMTGLWQVSGRSELGNAGMLRWDPYYVRNWSIWLDVVILIRTFRAVVFRRGAR